jgi:hypothetical protein
VPEAYSPGHKVLGIMRAMLTLQNCVAFRVILALSVGVRIREHRTPKEAAGVDAPIMQAARRARLRSSSPGRQGMSDYWDAVRRHWTRFEVAAGAGGAPLDDVIVKPMRTLSLYRTAVPIVVTGLRGAGKSVLYESLIGKVRNSYVPHGPSLDVESHKTFIRSARSKIRAQAIVLPGQDSDERAAASIKIFGHGSYPAGVIHAASWGYGTVWEVGDQESVAEEIEATGRRADLEAIHEWNLREELGDFEETCTRLKEAWGRRSQVWLIIAVTKCDLYWSDLGRVRDYYIPGRPTPPHPGQPPSESAFCQLLRGVVEYVGEGNCKVAVVPLSCYTEAYRFNAVSKQASLDARTTANLVNQFRGLVGEFCES